MGEADYEDQQNLYLFGLNLGMAFQIKDDLLDYQSSSSILGKPVGADLKEKKITLPLILSLNQAPESERKAIIKSLKKGVDTQEIKTIIRFCEKYNGLADAEQKMLEIAGQAKTALADLPETDEKMNALNFVDYIIDRRK